LREMQDLDNITTLSDWFDARTREV
jgi:hypothetical protein